MHEKSLFDSDGGKAFSFGESDVFIDKSFGNNDIFALIVGFEAGITHEAEKY